MFFREVIGSIYPWDLRDEGAEAILDNLQQRANCNMVYLIAVEIGHKRPITDDYYPHNPARKFNLAEEGRAYFRTRRGVGEAMKLIAAIGSRPKATPELVRLGVRIAAETGCDGLSIGHYEGTTFECLDAIGDGLRQAGVAVAAP